MVKNKLIGIGFISTVATLCFTFSAIAGLPTMDYSVMGAKVGNVKNGVENLKGIKGITSKVGELNTVVGDAAGSLAKFKEQYGADIEKAMEAAKKAQERVSEAQEAYTEYSAEIEERKSSYQAALDTVEGYKGQASAITGKDAPIDEENVEDMSDFPNEEFSEELDVSQEGYQGEYTEESAEGDEEERIQDGVGVMDPAYSGHGSFSQADFAGDRIPDGVAGVDGENRIPDGVAGVDENLDSVAENVVVSRAVNTSPSLMKVMKAESPDSMTVAPDQGLKKVMKDVSGAASNVAGEAKVAPRKIIPPRGFRVSPQKMDKLSSAKRYGSEKIAFAAAEESPVGNSYINNHFVVPVASLCGVNAEEYVKDEKIQKECHESIIINNSASNQFDATNSRKDCQKMIYGTIIALLSEATNAKYEAANYSDTLDEQDKDAASSTDVRGDMAILGMTNYQIQLLLNRMSLSLSSQVMLDTVEQLCGIKADTVGLKGEDETGEK